MSSFHCERCGKAIIDTPNGYITFCEHYPKENPENSDKDYLKELISDAKDSD